MQNAIVPNKSISEQVADRRREVEESTRRLTEFVDSIVAKNKRANELAVKKFGLRARKALRIAKDMLARWPKGRDWENGAIHDEVYTVMKFVTELEEIINPKEKSNGDSNG